MPGLLQSIAVAMHLPWERLIRFVGEDEATHYGEPIIPDQADIDAMLAAGRLQAKLIKGHIFDEEGIVTDTVVSVAKLLSPLACDDVPIMRCVGLNYIDHGTTEILKSRCFGLCSSKQ